MLNIPIHAWKKSSMKSWNNSISSSLSARCNLIMHIPCMYMDTVCDSFACNASSCIADSINTSIFFGSLIQLGCKTEYCVLEVAH